MKHIIFIIAAALLLCACTCSTRKSFVNDISSQSDVAPRDSDIYNMGRRHAAYLINHYFGTDSMGYKLLDIRARQSEIETKVDSCAADAYILGFTDYIRTNCPALADSIL